MVGEQIEVAVAVLVEIDRRLPRLLEPVPADRRETFRRWALRSDDRSIDQEEGRDAQGEYIRAAKQHVVCRE